MVAPVGRQFDVPVPARRAHQLRLDGNEHGAGREAVEREPSAMVALLAPRLGLTHAEDGEVLDRRLWAVVLHEERRPARIAGRKAGLMEMSSGRTRGPGGCSAPANSFKMSERSAGRDG